MKRLLLSLIAFTALTVFSQEENVQSGTLCLMEVANGKKVNVYLQNLENGRLIFQAPKSTKNIPAPADKIKSLKFSMSKEVFDFARAENLITDEKVSEIFAREGLERSAKLDLIFEEILDGVAQLSYQGDHAGYVSKVEPLFEGRGSYMSINNNLIEYYLMLMEAYRNLDNFSKVKECAAVLLESSDKEVVQKAKVALALVAIAENDIETADTISGELSSKAAALFIKASIERAKGNLKDSMNAVTTIIADHANDQDWMPQTELLAANIYLDMTGTNSVISTNSAINTSRQVKNIYAGSAVAGEARVLWASLGGEAIEAAENKAKAERLAQEKKRKEEQAAKREQERLAKKAAREAAKQEEAMKKAEKAEAGSEN